MLNKRFIVGGLLFVTLLGGGVMLGVKTVLSDDFRRGYQEHAHEKYEQDKEHKKNHPDRHGAALNPTYVKACGSCHFAFQPRWLTGATWQHMLDGLENHFDENAQLDPATTQQLRDYLSQHGAKGNRSLDPASMRITDTRFFRHAHDEIPAKLVKDNPKVGSWSRCDLCHSDAQQGKFDEDRARIPGAEHRDD
ncbi:hypothetical protein Mmc1_0314 [Magnetococcus marinus MC-1]|uniref:Diheme cytochrome c n=1 Tax=Magnetococcus marinus (strain ATCC BAA-1437 / JCM 17883 / MC-1) TaxID=156889 RepID=A0L4E8_MAGMM|nr:diheme cytochrome c [Magnetococcus marinus]ABK42841.1 hypothetical protein Mmc1_0314 [Magnetococcus marinus MC-1]